jgi:predicted ArsR family transcriptional regulator
VSAAEVVPPEDGRTRQRVLGAVLDHGPISASALAKMMGLTAAAIRRHLDALTDEGLIEVRSLAGQRAGRGRPALHRDGLWARPHLPLVR